MRDMLHKIVIATPPTTVYAALTEQHHPKSGLHCVFTGLRATESTS